MLIEHAFECVPFLRRKKVLSRFPQSSRKLDKFPHQALKGQCHESFDHFKNGVANFFVFAKIFNPKIENRVSV